jgi:hypothetical protein
MLLAQRAGDVTIGPAIVRLSGPAGDQDFRGAGFRGIGGEALALLISLTLAELVGSRLTVRRTVCRSRTYHAPGHDRRWPGQSRQRIGGILGRILGARIPIVDGLAWTFERRKNRERFFEHLSDFIEHARIVFALWRSGWRSGLALPKRGPVRRLRLDRIAGSGRRRRRLRPGGARADRQQRQRHACSCEEGLGKPDEIAGSIKYGCERNLKLRAGDALHGLQTSRAAMTKPNTRTPAPSATHKPSRLSISARIVSP